MAKRVEENKIETYYFSDTSFNLLMQNSIRKVLVICSSYDFFMLEEDGRIDEQIFNEYVSLNLRYPPVFLHANSARKAMQILENDHIDLIIEMLSIGDIDTFELARKLKEKHPKIPIVVLTHFSREVSLKLENEDLSAIDYVFCWLGNSDLLLAIIKLIEDRMNADFDIQEVGVQTILLVEDSVRFVSAYLPVLYKVILEQSMEFMKEALNEHQKMLRRRGRPKILMAQNYADALTIYRKYRQNILGIISDVSYKMTSNRKDAKIRAGIELCRLVRSEDKNIPFLLQSSDISNELPARELGAGFLHKHSKTLSNDLKDYIFRYFGFGEFVFRHPDTLEEYCIAANLRDLQQLIMTVPDHILIYHTQRDDISKWLNARALFPIAQIFKPAKLEDFKSLEDVRKYIYKAISSFRSSKAKGVIAEFDRHLYDEYVGFSRIGEGSIGGKARGLAFFNNFLKKDHFSDKFRNVIVSIPHTVVLSTEVFEEFMHENDLFGIAISGITDDEILKAFVGARLPEHIYQDLGTIILQARHPLAVRSSSKLEDSYYQPFAGIYNTYMIPIVPVKSLAIRMLETAIKCVYASVFFKASKAYALATSNLIDEEKMGIIIQEVCGRQYNDRFYPALSGVARSINFYPISPEKAGDGIATIGFGLGKLIAEGGGGLRFSPKYPRKIMQLSNPEMAVKSTQKYFYALNMNPDRFVPSVDDKINLMKLDIREAEPDGTLQLVSSVYDHENNMIRDGFDIAGKKIITFSNVLNHGSFPLAEILDNLLELGQQAMNNPIEMEFAVDLDVPRDNPVVFNFLQIRPIVVNEQSINFKIDNIDPDRTIIYSEKALGNGIYNGIADIVYVKPETFNPADSQKIARDLEKLNEQFIIDQLSYVLIGPGRWGSCDPWLGIPIKWPQISAARIIVESGLEHYRVDPSQGTHFFHNLTTFGVGYLTINPFMKDGIYNVDYLHSLKAWNETTYLRHIRFDKPMKIEIDGKSNKAVVYKPGKE
ncbi:MAG TPA: PEP/pyruvate-binding domain-containing protein [Bacteroidales bacterium]|nr:PEP/pyruvate-binding domain-containing protein [Bacteroidales bacterium]